MKENCTNCRFVHRQRQQDQNGQPVIGVYFYTCRHSPPVPMVIPTGPTSANLASHFPLVTDQIRCAQYEAVPAGGGK